MSKPDRTCSLPKYGLLSVLCFFWLIRKINPFTHAVCKPQDLKICRLYPVLYLFLAICIFLLFQILENDNPHQHSTKNENNNDENIEEEAEPKSPENEEAPEKEENEATPSEKENTPTDASPKEATENDVSACFRWRFYILFHIGFQGKFLRVNRSNTGDEASDGSHCINLHINLFDIPCFTSPSDVSG